MWPYYLKKKKNLRNKWRSLSSHTCCTVYIEFLCSTLRSKRPYIMNPFCSWIWLPCTFHRQAALFSVSKCQHTCISVVESQCVHKTWWNTPSPRALYNTIPITHQFHRIHLFYHHSIELPVYILLDDFSLWGWSGFRLALIRSRNVYDFKVSTTSSSFFFYEMFINVARRTTNW